MKKTNLRSKDAGQELSSYNLVLTKKDIVELVESDPKILLINHQPSFFIYSDKWVPTLKFLMGNDLLKKIVVDMGAIKFLISGADVMRPGIVSIDEEIKKDDFIVVVDQNNQKPIAVGLALFDFSEMKAMEKGNVIKNIHYVGDEIWGFTEK